MENEKPEVVFAPPEREKPDDGVAVCAPPPKVTPEAGAPCDGVEPNVRLVAAPTGFDGVWPKLKPDVGVPKLKPPCEVEVVVAAPRLKPPVVFWVDGAPKESPAVVVDVAFEPNDKEGVVVVVLAAPKVNPPPPKDILM